MSNSCLSSIGKKLIMSISGLFLVLFLLFHMSMNVVAIFSGEAYNAVCEFLGANWYALAGTLVLAAGFVFHIVYAFILTIQNRKARGAERYACQEKPSTVEWASQNMLVLGCIVFVGLALHLSQFWYKMQFAEIAGVTTNQFGVADGAAWMQFYFSKPLIVVCYLIWFVAIWFHLGHGFWSALQTIGWNNKVWIDRWRCISNIVTTIIFLGFAAVVIAAYIKSLCC